jgi:LPS-assembly lipoprotein
MNVARFIFIISLFALLSACGFHLQGQKEFPAALQSIYIQTPDRYSYLVHVLKQYFKMSHVKVVDTIDEARSIMVILRDDTAQQLLGVSGTQQTRQYNLKVYVTFEITDRNGRVLLPAQAFDDSRTITIQSNQILGTSNEALLYYQQIRRSLVTKIMDKLSSKEVSEQLTRTSQ